ncbi:ARM repeat-containing protein [Cristinia sonorae]|uniref:ARM repeat-containing protein n=1 Tax=Cristinia sonorae TaxID=1940300 RepID=A0A8K0UWX4_9AGAR|nr:ARM repeat-containing protein [Cristinia sonorae]
MLWQSQLFVNAPHSESGYRLVDCINNPVPYLEASQGSGDDIRIEAAHVIASLSYGSSDALRSLLSVNAHQVFLYAVSRFQPTDSPALRSAIARALRALVVAIADAVGPEQWGLRSRQSDMRDECGVALDYLFEVEALDVYLPLLEDHSSYASSSTAQLLGAALRSQPHRLAVTNWQPPAERAKEVKGKRGWEKADLKKQTSCWAVRQLVVLLQKKDVKLQEAALYALAALAKGNRSVAEKMLPMYSEQAALPCIVSLCKSRNVELQIAACLCAANVIRGCLYTSLHPQEQAGAMTIIHVVNGILTSTTQTAQIRTKACFILYHLVADEKELCQLAYDRGVVSKLAHIIVSITPTEPLNTWDEDEPESVSALREAAFTAIAAIALFDNDIRCEITDQLHLIPYIQASLTHRHIGVRYAACQCVRALSRAVAVLRTNIMDTGLGMAVFQIFVNGVGKEDKRVMLAVSAVICNLVNDFSPLRSVLIEQGVVSKLIELLHSDDPGLKLNALWAFKNLLFKSTKEVKEQVVASIGGWNELASYLNMESDPGMQEQAYHIVRHIADSEEGAKMVFDGIGGQTLFSFLSNALESDDEDVVRQAVCCLGNLSNSYPHQRMILAHSRILASLRTCLVDAKVEVRRPAAACILELVRGHPGSYAHKVMQDAGIESTLRHISGHHGYVGAGSYGISGSPIARTGSGFQMGMEDDTEVIEKAKEALHWLEYRPGEFEHGSELIF